MEDEARPLPPGWVRSYDQESSHRFLVDTTKGPPRAIWHHPYNDDDFVNSLSGPERERVEQESINYKRDHPPSKEDYIHAPSDLRKDLIIRLWESWLQSSLMRQGPAGYGQAQGQVVL